MAEENLGIIKFRAHFQEKYCTLKDFISPLREMPALSFGFQSDRIKTYEFEGLTRILSSLQFEYGGTLGLFVQNNQTQKQAEFIFHAPDRPPDVQSGGTIEYGDFEIDITQILGYVA
jgi:hypothetical protein